MPRPSSLRKGDRVSGGRSTLTAQAAIIQHRPHQSEINGLLRKSENPMRGFSTQNNSPDCFAALPRFFHAKSISPSADGGDGLCPRTYKLKKSLSKTLILYRLVLQLRFNTHRSVKNLFIVFSVPRKSNRRSPGGCPDYSEIYQYIPPPC